MIVNQLLAVMIFLLTSLCGTSLVEAQSVLHKRHVPTDVLAPRRMAYFQGAYYGLHENGRVVHFNPEDLSVADVDAPASEYIVDLFYANHRLWIRSGAGRLWHMGDSQSSWTLSAHGVTATFVDFDLALTYASGDSVFRYSPRPAGAPLEREMRLQIGSSNIRCVAVRDDTTLVGRSGDTVLLGFVGREEAFQIDIDAPVAEYPKLFSDSLGRLVLQNRTWRSLFVQEPSLRNGFRVLNGELWWLSGLMIHQVVQHERPVIMLYALNGTEGRSDLYRFVADADSLELFRIRNFDEVEFWVVAFSETDTALVSFSGEYACSINSRWYKRDKVVPKYQITPMNVDGGLGSPEFSRSVRDSPSELSALIIWRKGRMQLYASDQQSVRRYVGNQNPRSLLVDGKLFIEGGRGLASTADDGVSWDTLFQFSPGLSPYYFPSYRLTDGVNVFLPEGGRRFRVSTDAGSTWTSQHVNSEIFGALRDFRINGSQIALQPTGGSNAVIIADFVSALDSMPCRMLRSVLGESPYAIGVSGDTAYVVARLLRPTEGSTQHDTLVISVESVERTHVWHAIDLSGNPIPSLRSHGSASISAVSMFSDTISVYFPTTGRLIRIINGEILDDRTLPLWMIAPLDRTGLPFVEFTSSSSMRVFTNLNDGIEMFIDYDAEYQEPVSSVDAEVDDALYHVYVKTIAPNPASTDVHISVRHHLRSDLKSLVVRIHDMEGRLMKNIDWHNSIVSQDPYELVVKTDVSGLTSGPYVLVVENSQFTHGRVIIIQR